MYHYRSRWVKGRVVSAWLHLYRLEGECALVNETDVKVGNYHQNALTQAQKRYFASIDELIRIRQRPQPAVLVNPVTVLEAPPG